VATLALPANGSAGASAIEPQTLQQLTFSGHTNFTIPTGAVVLSDPVAFPVKAQSILTVSLYLANGQTTNFITGHPGSRTTTYMAHGNLAGAVDVNATTGAQRIARWYFISAVSAWLPVENRALVLVGDSITDGYGTTTNGNDRWPDDLLARLQASSSSQNKALAVINQAAGGNRVLYDGNGPNAFGRIGRDALGTSAVRYVLLFEGVNDIGTCSPDPAAQASMGDRLLAAFDQIVGRVHGARLPIFGATITPFSGPNSSYGNPVREAQRQRVNAWIRGSGRFDAVVDFDAAVRDPKNASQLNPDYDFGDHLHLNPEGYRAMAAAVDLDLFDKFKDGVHTMV
jgi:lysophospholipase L1-like esterase